MEVASLTGTRYSTHCFGLCFAVSANWDDGKSEIEGIPFMRVENFKFSWHAALRFTILAFAQEHGINEADDDIYHQICDAIERTTREKHGSFERSF